MVLKYIESLGSRVLLNTSGIFSFLNFVFTNLYYIFNFKSYRKNSRDYLIEQIYSSGVSRLPAFLFLSVVLGSILIVITIIFAIQFNLIDQIGFLLVIFVVNEFSPMFTTLFFILSYGLSIQEKSRFTNKTEEELYTQVYVPKLLKSLFLIPFLSLLFATLMLLSGCIISIIFLNIDLTTYKNLIINSIELKNIFILFLKGLLLGFFTMIIPLYFKHKYRDINIDLSKSIIKVLVIMLVSLISIELMSILLIY